MSLINEALKKAQRQRHAAAAGDAAHTGDSPIAKRDAPKSTRSMLLLIAGAALLIVLSMVGTALWLTRTPATHATVATQETGHASVAAKPAEPAITAPETTGPQVTIAALGTPLTSTAAPTAAASNKPGPGGPSGDALVSSRASAKAVRTEAPPPPPVTAPVPVGANDVTPTPASTPVAAAAPAAAPDERVHQFVESIRVMGIRSSGADSKVLMNDRVYRVNDIVNVSLGVRLTKVSSDSLTFTDPNGATYVKYF